MSASSIITVFSPRKSFILQILTIMNEKLSQVVVINYWNHDIAINNKQLSVNRCQYEPFAVKYSIIIDSGSGEIGESIETEDWDIDA